MYLALVFYIDGYTTKHTKHTKMNSESFIGFCVFSVFRGVAHMQLHLRSFFFDLTGCWFGRRSAGGGTAKFVELR